MVAEEMYEAHPLFRFNFIKLAEGVHVSNPTPFDGSTPGQP